MFSIQNGIFEGSIKNISSSGVFIISKKTFEVEQILTLALPVKNKKIAKIESQIVWTNDEGFGIKFSSIDEK
jgi:hypothetical protein